MWEILDLKKDAPRVYIVMPCYNGEKYLLEQLISVYNQNYKNWYLIFINDGSTDSSEIIARNFVSNYNLYDKVKIITKKNWWVNSAVSEWLNEVRKIENISISDSFIAFCDSDDIWTREKLSVQVGYMLNHPECGMSYHDMCQIDENGILIKKSMLKNKYHLNQSLFVLLCYDSHYYSTMMMFKIKYINNILPLPQWDFLYQDRRTGVNLSLLNVNIHFINQNLVFYRRWHESLMNKEINYKNIKRLNEIKIYKSELLQNKYSNIDLSYELWYLKDRYNNWIIKKYSYPRMILVVLIKYPKVFCLLLHVFLYEKIFSKL